MTVAATDIFQELTEADPHSALGTTTLAGVLAAKAAIERFSLPGTLLFFGEPAEKVCGSKPVHAAKGYYEIMGREIVVAAFRLRCSLLTIGTPTSSLSGGGNDPARKVPERP